MAFRRSSRPTISAMNDWRPGMSRALTTPMATARAATCQYWTVRVHASTARVKAGAMSAI